MGTAFSSSLFGLSGSLVLGFLDLQAGQAQTRFFTNLEDWLSTVTDIRVEDLEGGYGDLSGDDRSQQLTSVLEQLSRKIDGASAGGDPNSGRTATTAMANLAEGIQGLVKHLRSEQQLMREWADQQSTQQEEIKQVLTKLNDVLTSTDTK